MRCPTVAVHPACLRIRRRRVASRRRPRAVPARWGPTPNAVWRASAHACHICITGIGLTPATSRRLRSSANAEAARLSRRLAEAAALTSEATAHSEACNHHPATGLARPSAQVSSAQAGVRDGCFMQAARLRARVDECIAYNDSLQARRTQHVAYPARWGPPRCRECASCTARIGAGRAAAAQRADPRSHC